MPTAPKLSRTSWLVLLIAVVALVSHVCALPAHAHAGRTSGVHHDMDSAAPHDGEEPGHGVHAASCDAVKAPAPTVMVPAATVTRVATVHQSRGIVQSFIDPVKFSGTPPLFLLHLVLLI